MAIDIAAFILLVMAMYKGLRKGLIIAVFSLLGFFIGLTAALKLSSVVADYIGTITNITQRWLPFLAFILVFIIVVFLVRLGAKMLEKVLQIAMLGWLNKLGGVLFYLFLYFFILSILLFYASQLHLIKEKTITDSVVYAYIQPLAPEMMKMLGSVIPFFRDMFDHLLHFFQKVSEKKQSAQYSFLLIASRRPF
jgi:membrane protein required for colicin V production